MPGINQPLEGVQGFTARFQALLARVANLEGWQRLAAASINAGGPPTGAAGGALTGTYPNPTLAATTTAPPSGAAGGALTGTYPNPTLAAATTAPPSGAAGGALTGTYPNPTLAAATTAPPSGAAGGALTGTYPNPTLALTSAPFLQLLTSGLVALAYGSASLVWPNSQTATALAVGHGLGRVPKVVLLTTTLVAPGAGLTYSWAGGTTSQFTLYGWATAAVNGTIVVSWLAIG